MKDGGNIGVPLIVRTAVDLATAKPVALSRVPVTPTVMSATAVPWAAPNALNPIAPESAAVAVAWLAPRADSGTVPDGGDSAPFPWATLLAFKKTTAPKTSVLPPVACDLPVAVKGTTPTRPNVP